MIKTYQPSNQGTRVFPPVKAPGTKIGGKMALVCSGRLIHSSFEVTGQGAIASFFARKTSVSGTAIFPI